jgi:Domain of unknown function (DUF929)
MGRTTNRQQRTADQRSAREQAAANRATRARADRRRRGVLILIGVVVLTAVGAGAAAYGVLHKNKVSSIRTAAPRSLVATLTANAAMTAPSVGAGAVDSSQRPYTIDGASLAGGGKPALLFIGAEFCPYCAAERWAIITALSRFGSFTGLQTITSSEDGLDTFTFLHAGYTSRYLRFDAREQADQNGKALQTLTATQTQQWNRYLEPGSNGPGYPFMDLNGKYVYVTPLVDPSLLDGKTWQQIAAAVAHPVSALGKAEVGAANYLTATICQQTHDQPVTACPAAVTRLASGLPNYPAAS